MVEPTVVPRSEHAISRRDIDPDALKVLYRLHEHNYVAYLVGGSVRDLLLHRRPKDFDIGTSAHPHQVKKLFRNCWIIGRRFRLAHVKFGTKTIEVATFRRLVDALGRHAGSRSRRSTPRRGAARTGCARRRTRRQHPRGGGGAADPAPRRRSPHPARQHLRHPGRGRVPPRLHRQRALLRHRHVLDHRLHRRAAGPRRAR